MSYSSAIYYCDPISGSDTARTALTTCTASNPSGTITRIAKTAHGQVTGAIVDTTLFTAWLNGRWKITVVDANNFDLDGAVWQTTADASGTVTPLGGSSKADAWKTANGGTSTRVVGGDTVRVIASPDPTLVGNATWTDDSKTVTLAGAVNADIDDGETAWTASANVTATADTTAANVKRGTKSSKLVFASGFTTGLAAYRATGALDLSGYQQVSFWVKVDAVLAAGVLSLRLCTDTAGVTSVHTVPIPQIFAASQWQPVVVDLATNLNSAIQSVAMYCDTDPGTVSVWVDNIVACKASASADSLTHHSLIGKAHNLYWAASTVHAADTIRKPTSANRNGYAYKVTAGGGGSSGGTEPTWPRRLGETVADGALTWTCTALEETWYALQSISGTTLKIDGHNGSDATSVQVYSGTTETVATYKREPMIPQPGTSSSTTSPLGVQGSNGSATLGYVMIMGGWNRTDMTTQTGESWFTGSNGQGSILSATGANFTQYSHLGAVRMLYGLRLTSSCVNNRFLHCHANHMVNDAITGGSAVHVWYTEGCRADCNTAIGIRGPAQHWTGVALSACGNSTNPYGGIMPAFGYMRLRDVVVKNTKSGYGISGTGTGNCCTDAQIVNLMTANNSSGGIDSTHSAAGDMLLINPTMTDSTVIFTDTAQAAAIKTVMQNFNGDVTDQRTYLPGGTIRSATDQRHTASGLSWKFLPTSATNQAAITAQHPLILSVAKIACSANVAVSVRMWTRRDSTNVKGQLFLAGGHIAGVPLDLTVACEPTINTWVQSSALTFTPTEDGVVEIEFRVWDGVGTSNSYWIDDMSVTQ